MTDIYKKLCTALAESASLAYLKETIDIVSSAKEKQKYYGNFESKIISICDRFIPCYAKKIRRGKKPPVMMKEQQKNFWQVASSQSLLEIYIDDMLKAEEKKRAIQFFSDYIGIYRGYIMRLLTEQLKPHINDWGDLELFKYLQPGSTVATAEERWRKIAEKAGIALKVRWVKPKNQSAIYNAI